MPAAVCKISDVVSRQGGLRCSVGFLVELDKAPSRKHLLDISSG